MRSSEIGVSSLERDIVTSQGLAQISLRRNQYSPDPKSLKQKPVHLNFWHSKFSVIGDLDSGKNTKGGLRDNSLIPTLPSKSSHIQASLVVCLIL